MLYTVFSPVFSTTFVIGALIRSSTPSIGWQRCSHPLSARQTSDRVYNIVCRGIAKKA
jgi:hypothetical protein